MRRSAEVLFLFRSGTGYRDGEYGLPSGKVEPGETLMAAARREAAEETGVAIEPWHVAPAHVMERDTPTGRWLDWFCIADTWNGEPVNNEPEKCPDLAWLHPDDPRISDYVRAAIRCIGTGIPFSTYEGP